MPRRAVPPASLAQLWSEREGFVWAYWGVFGTLNVDTFLLEYDNARAGGFASVAAGNLLTMDEHWRKLELVAETARKVWG